MRLGDRQRAFMRMVPRLIDKGHELGYEFTGGDLLRDKRCPYGSKTSKHHTKEAIDLNAFKRVKGKIVYIRSTEGHRELGEWWKSVGGVWGGDFKKPDGNHYQGSPTGLYEVLPTWGCDTIPVEEEQTVTITISSNAKLNVEVNDK